MLSFPHKVTSYEFSCSLLPVVLLNELKVLHLLHLVLLVLAGELKRPTDMWTNEWREKSWREKMCAKEIKSSGL